MAKEVTVTAIKPMSDEIEYGIQEDGNWVVHGIVIHQPVGLETKGVELVALAIADARAKGLISD